MCVLFSCPLNRGFISADTAVRPFSFPSTECERFRRYSGAPLEARMAADGQTGHCRRPAAETRGDRAPMVPFPLLTPQTLLWTRLPPVARLKARGPQGRSVLQGYALDRSGAFRSAKQAPCTVWPRTVMRGKLRKGNSGHNSVPKAARRTEPSPRLPRLAANALLSGQRKVKGVSRGDIGNRRCPTSPFAPAVGTAAIPGLPIGSHSSPAAASRRNGGTAHPCSREEVKFEAITASCRRRKRTTRPPER